GSCRGGRARGPRSRRDSDRERRRAVCGAGRLPRAARRDACRRHRARRGARRHDERVEHLGAVALRARVRARQRATLPRARTLARGRRRLGGRAEPRRRCRHARRPPSPAPAARSAHAGVCGRPRRAGAAVKTVVLSGGVGGARFVRGLADLVSGADLTVVGNVGDDVEVLGMYVSPDLDSILYALADVNDAERGWGRADESWRALETVAELGGESWFRLGDRDLGLHLVRTVALRDGAALSAVTQRFARAFGLEATLVPATDDRLRTWIATPAGEFSFQEWFVARGHRDEVDGVRFAGAEEASAARGVVEAIDAAELLLIAPSNP